MLQVDTNPRVESSWIVGGILPPNKIRNHRKILEWVKHMANDPVDRMMTYIGSPNLFLRAREPLNIIMSPSDAENPDLDVPFFKYDPVSIGGKTEHRHIANIPGNEIFFRNYLGNYRSSNSINSCILKCDSLLLAADNGKQLSHPGLPISF